MTYWVFNTYISCTDDFLVSHSCGFQQIPAGMGGTHTVKYCSPPMTSKMRELSMRLPYPAGDHTSSPETFSPSNSPPLLTSSAIKPLSVTILGYLSIHHQDWVHYQVLCIPLLHFSHCLLLEWVGLPYLPAQLKFVSTSANWMASWTSTTKGWESQGLPPL